MPAYPLPTIDGVTDMLSGILGRDVSVSSGPAVTPDVKPLAFVSAFTGTSDTIVMACICDIGFACNAGAALSMLPAGGAEDCIDSGVLSEAIQENFYEMMNITSTILNDQDAPRLVLRELLILPEASLPDDLAALIGSADGRADFKIGISGYGDGGMSILMARVRS